MEDEIDLAISPNKISNGMSFDGTTMQVLFSTVDPLTAEQSMAVTLTISNHDPNSLNLYKASAFSTIDIVTTGRVFAGFVYNNITLITDPHSGGGIQHIPTPHDSKRSQHSSVLKPNRESFRSETPTHTHRRAPSGSATGSSPAKTFKIPGAAVVRPYDSLMNWR